ncbi:MAG: hypothetical protein HRF49_12235 [bacterium]
MAISERELFFQERELDLIAERLERGELTASELFEFKRKYGDALDAAINRRVDDKLRARLAAAAALDEAEISINRRGLSFRLPEAAGTAAKAALTAALAATAGLLLYMAFVDGAIAIARYFSGRAF